MNVAEAVGRTLVGRGVSCAFGVVGSGNFHVTNALIAAGARFFAAAHEGGAASMADGYARVSGRLTALSVHQGPGVTNALTGIVEAAKSRTPLLVLAPEATHPRSNFFVDLPGIAAAIGAGFRRITADRAAIDTAEACRIATSGAGQTVILGLPLDVQAQPAGEPVALGSVDEEPGAAAVPAAIKLLADALAAARRPVFIAGRGAARTAVRSRGELTALAERCGALLAVSAAARGLFSGDPWYLDVSGGFSTPLTAELVPKADLAVDRRARAEGRPDRRVGQHAQHVDHAARPADRARDDDRAGRRQSGRHRCAPASGHRGVRRYRRGRAGVRRGARAPRRVPDRLA